METKYRKREREGEEGARLAKTPLTGNAGISVAAQVVVVVAVVVVGSGGGGLQIELAGFNDVNPTPRSRPLATA